MLARCRVHEVSQEWGCEWGSSYMNESIHSVSSHDCRFHSSRMQWPSLLITRGWGVRQRDLWASRGRIKSARWPPTCTIRCGYSQIRIVSAVSALGPDTVRYNTYCIYCIWVQIQWIQPVSAPGPDTVDTYRTCRASTQRRVCPIEARARADKNTVPEPIDRRPSLRHAPLAHGFGPPR